MTQDELGHLLAWFHADPNTAAEQYEIMRLKLIEWFERRGSRHAPDMADKVLDRVAKRVAEGGEPIRGRAFFIGVAKNVFRESVSRPEPTSPSDGIEPVDPNHDPETLLQDAAEAAVHRHRVACMVQCLRELPPDDFRLLRDYYRPGARGTRREIAQGLGLSPGGLYTRMHRIKAQLAARLDKLLRSRAV